MMEMSDREWLMKFAAKGDEAAFQRLVERHLPLVIGVARRVTANDELARDVSQQVFVRLVREANRIPRDLALVAWLHRVTRHLAIDLVRSESRRKRRESLYLPMSGNEFSDDRLWQEVAPLIDDLVNRLPGIDRDVLLLRYFENQSHAEVARQLGMSEAAAKKRAVRALEKLREMLGRKGVTSTTAVLATLLPAHAVPALPLPLIATVASSAQGAASQVPGAFGFHLSMTTAQKTAVVATAVLSLVSFSYAVRGGTAVDADDLVKSGLARVAADAGRPAKLSVREDVSLSADERLERIRRIMAIPEHYERTVAMIELVSLIGSRQFAETLEQVGSFEDGAARELSQLLIATWAKVEPRAAAAWAIEQEAFPDILFSCWAEYDPDGAMEWVLKNLPEAVSADGADHRHLIGLLATVAVRDPSKAVDLIERFPESETRRKILVHTGARLTGEGPDAFEALVDACDAGAARNALVEFGAGYMIRSGRARTALDWFSENEIPREDLRVRDAFRRACQFEPETIRDQLEQLPEGTLKDEAVAGVCLGSVQQIPTDELFALLEKHPGAATDAVIGGIVDELPYRERLDELWRVKDPGYREDLQEAALISWATGLPDHVRTWMDEHPVSDGVRARVLEAISRKPEP